jgi:hypothetical protein
MAFGSLNDRKGKKKMKEGRTWFLKAKNNYKLDRVVSSLFRNSAAESVFWRISAGYSRALWSCVAAFLPQIAFGWCLLGDKRETGNKSACRRRDGSSNHISL